MVLRREAAQERMLAGLSMPVIRDVITVRRYVPRMESSGVSENCPGQEVAPSRLPDA